MKVGVTGASGYVGKKVVKELQKNSHEVFKFVRRSVKNEHEIYWSPSKQEIDVEKFEQLDAIIHLAGESIAPKDLLGFLPFAGGRGVKRESLEFIGHVNGHLTYLFLPSNLLETFPKSS